jgi:hypothetical protein
MVWRASGLVDHDVGCLRARRSRAMAAARPASANGATLEGDRGDAWHPPGLSGEGALHRPLVSHAFGATQSSTDSQAGLQAPLVAHLYGEQSCLVPLAPVVVCSPSHVPPAPHARVVRLQMSPIAQSESCVHEFGQDVLFPSQTYGEQDGIAPGSRATATRHVPW